LHVLAAVAKLKTSPTTAEADDMISMFSVSFRGEGEGRRKRRLCDERTRLRGAELQAHSPIAYVIVHEAEVQPICLVRVSVITFGKKRQKPYLRASHFW
jgi:hypothetical protein